MSQNILIVDNEPSACQTIEGLLAPYGMSLHSELSAAAALEYLQCERVDLIIADVMMPVTDGFSLCRRLKEHSQWRFIPIILVSALDDESDIVHGLEAGADEFLTKPINKFALRARVRVMLRIRERYQELAGKSAVTGFEELVRRRVNDLVESVHISKREREVLDLLLLGRSADEIGLALHITSRTAKFHQVNVLKKLGIDSRHELLRVLL